MSDGLLFFVAIVASIGWNGFRSTRHDKHGWRWWCVLDQLSVVVTAAVWLWVLYHRLGNPWGRQ